MRRINLVDVAERTWRSPEGTFEGAGKHISEALGRDPLSTDMMRRHPFDVELVRIPPGKKAYPYHSHSAQWEFYLVVAGTGISRDADGNHHIASGDAFLYQPGEAHQLINDGECDLDVYVIADNPVGESAHYPDSEKWIVRSPSRTLLRGEVKDYFDGEE